MSSRLFVVRFDGAQTNAPVNAFKVSDHGVTSVRSVSMNVTAADDAGADVAADRKLLLIVAGCSISVRDLLREELLCVIEGHTSPPSAVQVSYVKKCVGRIRYL